MLYYHTIVAVRKGSGKKAQSKNQKPKKKSPPPKKQFPVILFWLAFAIFVFGLFIFNREAISKSIGAVKDGILSRNEGAGPLPPEVTPIAEDPAPPAVQQPSGGNQGASSQPATQPPATQPPAAQPAAPGQPAVQTTPTQPPAQSPPAVQPAPETRDRALYFILVDRSGSIVRVRVDRKLPASDSPLKDAIEAIIAGPNQDEKSRGMISLVPAGTKILSAAVRENTAFINFSEEFQYNTYGVEGYAGQVRQIVFTATEFPNVSDVQILIEGRRLDYLGEGIWIGSPLRRDQL